MMAKPLISVVVLGFRQFERNTGPCLSSLKPWFADADLEFIVVDNGSTDDAEEKTRHWCQQHPTVKYICSPENLGFAGGMNLGVSHATGEWVLLVNNDTLFPDRALDALKEVIRSAPQKAAMLGPITNAAGNGQRLYRTHATVDDWLKQGAWLNTHPTHQLLAVYRCDFFCIAVRRDVWEILGGLDTSFGLGYYEDFDFSLRLRAAGWEQYITEDVFVLHVGSASFQASAEAKRLIRKNKALLKRKHAKIVFEHTRAANLHILEQYVQLKTTGQWSSALEARLLYRLEALTSDVPRSFVKRWFWMRKTKRLLNLL